MPNFRRRPRLPPRRQWPSYRGATQGCPGSTDRRVHRSRGRRRPCADVDHLLVDRPGVGGAPAPLTFSTVWSKLGARPCARGWPEDRADRPPTRRHGAHPAWPRWPSGGAGWPRAAWPRLGHGGHQGEQRSSGHIRVRTSGERLLDLLPTVIAATPSTPATAPRRAPRTRRGPRRLNPLIRSPLLRSFRRRLDPPATPRAASQPSRGTSAALQRACSVPVRPAGWGRVAGRSATDAR